MVVNSIGFLMQRKEGMACCCCCNGDNGSHKIRFSSIWMHTCSIVGLWFNSGTKKHYVAIAERLNRGTTGCRKVPAVQHWQLFFNSEWHPWTSLGARCSLQALIEYYPTN
jgi:hypothetical protein